MAFKTKVALAAIRGDRTVAELARRLLSERIAVSKPNRQTGDPVMAQMTALRRRMIDDMTLRNLSPATQQSYVYAVAKFSRFFGRSPDQLGVEEVRAYQIHLAGRGLSWPHLNQVSCALRFFFGVTLGRKDVVDRIVSAKEPKKLPIVLSSGKRSVKTPVQAAARSSSAGCQCQGNRSAICRAG